MEFYRFDKEKGAKITQFRSEAVMTRMLQSDHPVHISCLYLEEQGVLGYHQANVAQVLFVVNGEGYVRDEQERFVKITPGDAVFWQKGEWHETRSDKGLTAIVVEGISLHPSTFMTKEHDLFFMNDE